MSEKANAVYRFAPSPTGYLHVGGARTAIYNWLLARSQSGKFLLRIEDTDQDRSTAESADQIISSLAWLHIEWDDNITYQSARLDRYREVVHELVDSEQAYPCFCRRDELEQKKKNALLKKENFVYDGSCRQLARSEINQKRSSGLESSIRLKVKTGFTEYTDGVYGNIKVRNDDIGDFIIARSDGTPIYQLAVVVDDHDAGVTDVVRGEDHVPNTPKQILIYQALNWDIPQFSHLPLILGEDKKRLSKRHGAASVEEFKAQGIMPQALFNYLCLLGWAPGDDREIFSIAELIQIFSLDRVGKANAVFNHQKLLWMNAKYIAGTSSAEILNLIENFYDDEKLRIITDEKYRFTELVELLKPRVKTLNDFITETDFYFSDPDQYEQKGVEKFFTAPQASEWLTQMLSLLSNEDDYNLDKLEQIIRQFAAENDLGAGKVIHPLRLALTGKTASPGIFEVMSVLGRYKVQRRIKKAIDFIAGL